MAEGEFSERGKGSQVDNFLASLQASGRSRRTNRQLQEQQALSAALTAANLRFDSYVKQEVDKTKNVQPELEDEQLLVSGINLRNRMNERLSSALADAPKAMHQPLLDKWVPAIETAGVVATNDALVHAKQREFQAIEGEAGAVIGNVDLGNFELSNERIGNLSLEIDDVGRRQPFIDSNREQLVNQLYSNTWEDDGPVAMFRLLQSEGAGTSLTGVEISRGRTKFGDKIENKVIDNMTADLPGLNGAMKANDGRLLRQYPDPQLKLMEINDRIDRMTLDEDIMREIIPNDYDDTMGQLYGTQVELDEYVDELQEAGLFIEGAGTPPSPSEPIALRSVERADEAFFQKVSEGGVKEDDIDSYLTQRRTNGGGITRSHETFYKRGLRDPEQLFRVLEDMQFRFDNGTITALDGKTLDNDMIDRGQIGMEIMQMNLKSAGDPTSPIGAQEVLGMIQAVKDNDELTGQRKEAFDKYQSKVFSKVIEFSGMTDVVERMKETFPTNSRQADFSAVSDFSASQQEIWFRNEFVETANEVELRAIRNHGRGVSFDKAAEFIFKQMSASGWKDSSVFGTGGGLFSTRTHRFMPNAPEAKFPPKTINRMSEEWDKLLADNPDLQARSALFSPRYLGQVKDDNGILMERWVINDGPFPAMHNGVPLVIEEPAHTPEVHNKAATVDEAGEPVPGVQIPGFRFPTYPDRASPMFRQDPGFDIETLDERAENKRALDEADLAVKTARIERGEITQEKFLALMTNADLSIGEAIKAGQHFRSKAMLFLQKRLTNAPFGEERDAAFAMFRELADLMDKGTITSVDAVTAVKMIIERTPVSRRERMMLMGRQVHP